MMTLYSQKNVSGTSEIKINYFILIVQFVVLNTAYFPKDGLQVVQKYVGDFEFIVRKLHCFKVWCDIYIYNVYI